MNRTTIEWVKNPDGTQGYTWNLITGCLNHTPEGLCLGGMFPCYAFRLANGRQRQRYLANTNLAKGAKGGVAKLTIGNRVAVEREGDYADPFFPRFWPERLIDPIQDISYAQSRRWGKLAKTKGIFVCDMGELFGDWVPREWQDKIFGVIKSCPQHRFYLLTKQPQNLSKFSPFPDNCWVGVTATNHTMLIEAKHYLGGIEATTKFLSLEPLLEWHTHRELDWLVEVLKSINWLIIGACTGMMKELLPLHHKTGLPMIKWRGNKWILSPPIGAVEEIVRAADKAGIPVFLKDNLKPLILQHAKDKDAQWADILLDTSGKLRQEMPHSG